MSERVLFLYITCAESNMVSAVAMQRLHIIIHVLFLLLRFFFNGIHKIVIQIRFISELVFFSTLLPCRCSIFELNGISFNSLNVLPNRNGCPSAHRPVRVQLIIRKLTKLYDVFNILNGGCRCGESRPAAVYTPVPTNNLRYGIFGKQNK